MKPRILVVDDDIKISSMLRRSLGWEGYEVITAPNGSQGLEKAKLHPPDLVILAIIPFPGGILYRVR